MSTQQLLADGLCLRFSGDIASHPSLNVEMAINILVRGTQAAYSVPFTWGYIDRPQEGSAYLLFIAPHMQFPVDGLRFQENEQRYTMPSANNRELEVTEAKFGFIPNSQDTTAFRVRRKFRLTKGGNSQLWLVHYSKGQAMPLIPSMNQPVRSYPLPTPNQPAVYVLGDKAGQKVYPAGSGAQPSPSQPPTAPGMNMNFANTPQAMLAQQNRQMEALERRNAQEREQRARSGSAANRQVAPPTDDEEELEKEMISTRTLALTRFRRNHEFMDEVFVQAAMGERNPPRPSPAYSIFDEAETEEQVANLTSEIEELRTKVTERRMARVRLAETESIREAMSPVPNPIAT